MATIAAATTQELLQDPLVLRALDDAWRDSLPGDPVRRHEEGGWIYQNFATGQISLERAAPGSRARLDLSNPPPLPNAVVVGTFHTHPNPTADGWEPGPSGTDVAAAEFTGVPWLIRADDGLHSTGPDSRRGGLVGDPGYPS